MQMTNDEFLKKIPNDFMLTILLSRRVKELRRGSRPLVEIKSKNAVEIAFEEIRQGKIDLKEQDDKKPVI